MPWWQVDPVDGQEYIEISSVDAAFIALPSVVAYLLFSFAFDQDFRGLVAAGSLGVVLSVGWTLRPLRATAAYRVGLLGVAAAHVIMVASLPYTGAFSGAGMMLLPLFFADAYLCAIAIISANRRRAR